MIRKPDQRELRESRAALVAREASAAGSAVVGGVGQVFLTILLIFLAYYNLLTGGVLLLSGDFSIGAFASLLIGTLAAAVLVRQFRARRERRLAEAMCNFENAPSTAASPSKPRLGYRPTYGEYLNGKLPFSRSALAGKAVLYGFFAWVFAYGSQGAFGLMLVLALYLAFRTLVLLINIPVQSHALEINARSVTMRSVLGTSRNIAWESVYDVERLKVRFYDFVTPMLTGSNSIIRVSGFGEQGQEIRLLVPYKLLGLTESAAFNLLQPPVPSDPNVSPSRRQSGPSDPASAEFGSADRAARGFGRKGLTSN